MRWLVSVSLLVGALLGAPSQAQTSPVVGTWMMHIETPETSFDVTMTVSGSGGAYSVDFPDAPETQGQISNIVVDGGSLSFRRSVPAGQTSVSVEYDLDIEGDALSGEARSATGAAEITGTRM